MKYQLMHRTVPVALLSVNEEVGNIEKVEKVFAPEHLPVGIHVRDGFADRGELDRWWCDRSIPAGRSGVREALEALDIPSTKFLLTRCFGLSLSDQYWIRPDGREDLKWEDVNFFDRPFSEDIGDILLGKTVKMDAIDLHSPDNTSDGFLKKRWKIINGKRCLVKGGSAPLMLQPFNEVIATVISELLSVPHVTYRVIWDGGVPYSVCEDFIDRDTELVSAWRVMQTKKRRSGVGVFRHYLDCCEALGVSGVRPFLDRMIVLDYLIANEDRHLNNFGLVRNAETLEWIGPAPVFDSGSSLGYDKLPMQILSGENVVCKPFKKRHEDQIKLVSDFTWIDAEALDSIPTEIEKVFSAAGIYADSRRVEAVVGSVKDRISHLKKVMAAGAFVTDRTEDDVSFDICENYQL